MPKLSESKIWEARFLEMFKSCMSYTFGKDSRNHPRFLSSYTLKKTKSTKVKIQKGRVNSSTVYYNPTWMKTYINKDGIFNPCDIIDTILEKLEGLNTGKKGRKG